MQTIPQQNSTDHMIMRKSSVTGMISRSIMMGTGITIPALAGPIKREKLAALFGGAGHGFMAGKGLLIDEDGKYWLRSPDGQYGVDVEDVPFVIVDYNCDSNGDLVFVTNFDEQVFVRESGDVFLKEER